MRRPRPRLPLLAAATACLALAPATVRAAPPSRWDSGDPTATEQRVLETINRARAAPAAEGTRLGIDIDEGLPNGGHAVARPPLAMSRQLLSTARGHSQDMYARAYFAHTDPDGNDPFERMAAAGYSGGRLGENIAAGSSHPAEALEDLLMRDPGYPGRGHRVNLLDVGSGSPYREIGVGSHSGAVPISGSATANGMKDFLTEDFGASSTGPFVLGVVYADLNGNGEYDPGEGLGGVTVSPDSGDWYAVTGTAGGYAFPVAASGSIQVTASGGALVSPVRSNVALTGENVKVDFLPSGASGGGASNSLVDTDGDGFPDELETAQGTSPGDGGDTPFGGAPAAPVPLPAAHVAIRLDFATAASDRVTLSCRLPVAAGFDPSGAHVVVDVGGVVRDLVLDATGHVAGVPKRTVALRLRRVRGAVLAQRAQFTVRLADLHVAGILADEGLLDVTTRRPARVSVPAIVLFGGSYFTAVKRLTYTARHGRSGTAR